VNERVYTLNGVCIQVLVNATLRLVICVCVCVCEHERTCACSIVFGDELGARVRVCVKERESVYTANTVFVDVLLYEKCVLRLRAHTCV